VVFGSLSKAIGKMQQAISRVKIDPIEAQAKLDRWADKG